MKFKRCRHFKPPVSTEWDSEDEPMFPMPHMLILFFSLQMVDECVAEGDYSKAVGAEIVRLVGEKATAKEAAKAAAPEPPPPVSSSAANLPPPTPVAALPAAAAPALPTGGLSKADRAAAESEAEDLWKEVDKGGLTLDEVQEVGTGKDQSYA